MISRMITHVTICVALSLVIATTIIGCGGSKLQEVDDKQSPTTKRDKNSQSNNETKTKAPGNIKQASTNSGQAKMIGDIPYDVWFEDPITIAGDANKVAIVTPTNTGTTTPEMKLKEDPKPSEPVAAGGKIDWKEVIPAEVLNDEIKKIRNRFSQNLRNVGSYNRSYLALEPFCVSLAVLAEIGSEHPGDLRWKKNGKIIRDLAAQMVAEKLRTGAKSYKQVLVPFEQITDTLDGSPPADVKKPNPDDSFSDAADMGQIMKRMELLEKLIKDNAGTEGAFKKYKDDVRRQAYVLGAITKVLNTEGYGYADDEVFMKYSSTIVDACKEMALAAETDDYAAFEKAMPKINQSCIDCHTDYRN